MALRSNRIAQAAHAAQNGACKHFYEVKPCWRVDIVMHDSYGSPVRAKAHLPPVDRDQVNTIASDHISRRRDGQHNSWNADRQFRERPGPGDTVYGCAPVYREAFVVDTHLSTLAHDNPGGPTAALPSRRQRSGRSESAPHSRGVPRCSTGLRPVLGTPRVAHVARARGRDAEAVMGRGVAGARCGRIRMDFPSRPRPSCLPHDQERQ